MEATFVAKRALFNIPKFLPQGPPRTLSSTSRVTRACLSTANESAEGSNAVSEGSTEVSYAPRDPITDGTYDTSKNEAFATREGKPPESTTSFAADTAKEGVKKAVEMAGNVGDTAKQTLDGAWKVAKGTAQGIKETVTTGGVNGGEGDEIEEDVAVDEIRKFDQLVDTQEYRSIEESRAKSGGYEKA